MFTVSPANLQMFIDKPNLAADHYGQAEIRLTLMPPIIPNFNYVIVVSDLNV
jgi:hypothetical protein